MEIAGEFARDHVPRRLEQHQMLLEFPQQRDPGLLVGCRVLAERSDFEQAESAPSLSEAALGIGAAFVEDAASTTVDAGVDEGGGNGVGEPLQVVVYVLVTLEAQV